MPLLVGELHPEHKLRGLEEKPILRELARRSLPSSVSDRSKQPYRGPSLLKALSKATPDWVEEALSERSLRTVGLFDPSRVSLLVRKAREGRASSFRDETALNSILSTQIWYTKTFLEPKGVSP